MRTGNDGEGAIAAQGAQGKANVLSDGGNPHGASAFAAVLFDLIEAAEGEAGGATGLRFGHPCADIVRDLLLEVKPQFLVEFLLQSPAAEKALPPAHDNSPSGSCRMRATTSVRRAQLSVSLFNCARPRAVSS